MKDHNFFPSDKDWHWDSINHGFMPYIYYKESGIVPYSYEIVWKIQY